MYFVLAAQRLAALVSMIRDYDKNETVNIIAHSQGCLVSLLAQAFLMDQGRKPADTLILTHPPYALEPVHFEKYGREDGDGRDEDKPPPPHRRPLRPRRQAPPARMTSRPGARTR
jgi:pimeloyl-ACP methyl ester carboxylesterase